jgi:putative ABC transport system permease protein
LAVFTMALGIGATTAVFSVASSVLLRPLPYKDPAGLVMIWDKWIGWPSTWLSDAEFADYRDKSRSFADIGAFYDDARNLTGNGTPERIRIGVLSAGVLSALGTPPLHGRLFTAQEDYPGSPRVAVISHGLWLRRFGGDSSVIGRRSCSTTVLRP